MDLALTYRALARNRWTSSRATRPTDSSPRSTSCNSKTTATTFRPIEAVILARQSALTRQPALAEVLARLNNALTTGEMRRLNNEVDGLKRDIKQVAREWIGKKGLGVGG